MSGGGSGGHITPLLSLAHELKQLKSDCEIVYIGHKGDRFDSLKLSTDNFDFIAFIQAGKFRRYHGEGFVSHFNPKTFILNIRDFFRLGGSVLASLRILRKVRADVMFSKGGFVSLPVGLAAHILRIPIITHDSDSVPGLANRVVGRWATVRTSGMPLDDSSGKLYVGIPIKEEIKQAGPEAQKKLKKSLGLSVESQLLLVGGAGNGSRRINQLLAVIAPHLLSNNPGLHIVHFAGQAKQVETAQEYHATLDALQRKRVEVFGFSDDFFKYIAAADLIISRAGATSIAEFAAAAKACIIIPSPYLTGGHQLKNAKVLQDKDAAVVVADGVDPDELAALIGELLSNDSRRAHLAANLHKQAMPDASSRLAAIILKTAKKG